MLFTAEELLGQSEGFFRKKHGLYRQVIIGYPFDFYVEQGIEGKDK